ncbi:MAG: hypothetical protein ACI8RZ_006770 [Myxococcota bacterium]|jgi:hypothetical protein
MTTPISWIRLERYHLGEIDVAERGRIETELGDCKTSRGRLAQIQQDDRPMPALPHVAPRRRRSLVWGGLALAAAVMLAVLVPRGNTTKGGDVSLTLVRERAGSIAIAPATYRDGDRISLRLTCASGSPTISVTVQQGAALYTPIPDQTIRCGNQIPISGTFAVTAPGDLRICVATDAVEVCEDLMEIE